MTEYGSKQWFENKFLESNEHGDNWGHSYRASQKSRIKKCLNLINHHVTNQKKKILDIGRAK